MSKKAKKIDLGAGRVPHNGYLAVDKEKYPEIDIVHNLDEYPWPFDDECCISMIAHNILEHLESPWRGVREIIRICKEDARVSVRFPIPEHENAVKDDEHKYILTPRWFDLFDEIEIVEKEKHYPSPRLGKLDFLPLDVTQPDEWRLKLRVRK